MIVPYYSSLMYPYCAFSNQIICAYVNTIICYATIYYTGLGSTQDSTPKFFHTATRTWADNETTEDDCINKTSTMWA